MRTAAPYRLLSLSRIAGVNGARILVAAAAARVRNPISPIGKY